MTDWTIRLSLLAYVVAIHCLLLARHGAVAERPGTERTGPERRESPWRSILRAARWLWTVGAALLLLHIVAAFHFYHDWSHADAVRDTAERTRQVVGIAIGVGVWFNYLFALVWLGDVLLWWRRRDPIAYLRRRRWINGIVQGYLGFIAFNAVVVFESGLIRWLGITATLSVVLMWWMRGRVGRRTDSALSEVGKPSR